jgi:ATP-dependent RNA helicase DDX54/DBP10
MARTGSGKTGAFVIPTIEKLKAHSKVVGTRCIILSPSREIALQTANYFKNLSAFTDLTYVLIVGGNDMEN